MRKQVITILLTSILFGVQARRVDIEGISYLLITEGEPECLVAPKNTGNYSGSITIPSSIVCDDIEYKVVGIKDYAFAGAEGLTDVTLPESISKIGRNAFQGCSDLESLEVPAAVESLHAQTFYECSSLTSFKGSGIREIEESCFANCTMLENPGFGIVEKIGDNAFANCSSLETFIFPAQTELGKNIFSGCISLARVTLPESLPIIPDYTFYGCSSLREISLPSDLREIGDFAFYTCSSLAEFAPVSPLSRIGSRAFGFCSSLQRSSINGDGLVIGDYAFTGCNMLDKLKFEGVYEIGEESFSNCQNLREVYFDRTMHTIRERAFKNCIALESVICGTQQPPITAQNAFDKATYENAVLTVGTGLRALFMQIPPWSNFLNVTESEAVKVPRIVVSPDEMNIAVDGNGILFCSGGYEATVCSIGGEIIFAGPVEESVRLNLPGRGIYVITTKTHTCKISVK